MLEIGHPRLKTSRGFLQDLFRAVPRSRGAQLQKITVSTLSIQLGQMRIQSRIGFLIRSGIVIVLDPRLDRTSADGDVLQLGPSRSGNRLWIDFGENSDSF